MIVKEGLEVSVEAPGMLKSVVEQLLGRNIGGRNGGVNTHGEDMVSRNALMKIVDEASGHLLHLGVHNLLNSIS
jgi:hypothetical protein